MHEVMVRRPKHGVTVYQIEKFSGLDAETVGFFIDRLMEELKFKEISGELFERPVHVFQTFHSKGKSVLKQALVPADAEVRPTYRHDAPVFYEMWQQGENEDTLILHDVGEGHNIKQRVFRRLGQSEWFAEDLLSTTYLYEDEHIDGSYGLYRLKLVAVRLE